MITEKDEPPQNSGSAMHNIQSTNNLQSKSNHNQQQQSNVGFDNPSLATEEVPAFTTNSSNMHSKLCDHHHHYHH